MVSLRLNTSTKNESCQAINYIKFVVGTKGDQRVKRARPQSSINDDNNVKPIKETCTFQLRIKEEWVIQLSNQLTKDEKSSLQ